MLKTIDLKNVGPSRRMKVDFTPRLNLLTGDNGLGKTFILDVAWWVLTRKWADQQALPDPELNNNDIPSIGFEQYQSSAPLESKFSFEKQTWDPPPKSALEDVTVLYGRTDGGICLFEPLKKAAPFIFKAQDVWGGLKRGGKQLCNGLIKEIPTINMPYGRVPVTHASSGCRRVLSIAYLLVWMWSENREAAKITKQKPTKQMVFLFDELGSHLHPQWQRRLVPALMKVLEKLQLFTRVQFIASTHAPLVLASVEPIFNPREDALTVFDLIEGEVRVARMTWWTRGDVSSWLTSEVFGLGEAGPWTGKSH